MGMNRITLFSLCCVAFVAGTFGNRHVLVIGIDGVRPDALLAAHTPHLDGLMANGAWSIDAFAGGVLGTAGQQQTYSGPGWSSILTGVWRDRHGVNENSFTGADFENAPHFFLRIRESHPHAILASVVTWEPIHTSILAGADFALQKEGEDNWAVGETRRILLEEEPDVLFTYLGDPDTTGHGYGYSLEVPEYISSLEKADAQVGEMLDGLRARPNYEEEEWLVIVTTDHGGIGTGHGGQSEDERTIFFIAAGGENAPGIRSPGPGHNSVPPTLFRHLGVAVNPDWGWDPPFPSSPPHPSVVPAPANNDWTRSWWNERHRQKVTLARDTTPQILLVGDSITHFWEKSLFGDGGSAVWEEHFGKIPTLNLGFGADTTQNVLWRLQNGEIDGINPQVAVVMIGTNNASQLHSSPAVYGGVRAVGEELRKRLPTTPVLLLGIFPRGANKEDGFRMLNEKTNHLLSTLDGMEGVWYADMGALFLDEEGTLSPEIMPDLLHPNEEGYQRWAVALEELFEEMGVSLSAP